MGIEYINYRVRKYHNRSDGRRSNSNNIITKNTYKWNYINSLLNNFPIKNELSLSWILVQVFLILWHPILALYCSIVTPICKILKLVWFSLLWDCFWDWLHNFTYTSPSSRVNAWKVKSLRFWHPLYIKNNRNDVRITIDEIVFFCSPTRTCGPFV